METGFEPVYTDLQSVASPLGHSTLEEENPPRCRGRDPLRADDGIRTRDPHLGKVMLYQLSHVRTAPASARNRRPPTWLVRLETIAEPNAGVQTSYALARRGLSATLMIIFVRTTLTRCHPR